MEKGDMEIGKIKNSNSHIDYICEIFNEGMRENPPSQTDFEFGQFVYIKKQILSQENVFVGLIYDTKIVDPDQGRTGPRLSTPDEQNIFQPGYVDEKQILAGIVLLGTMKTKNGEINEVKHSIPKWNLEVDDMVKKLSKEDFVRFHEKDGEIKLEYFQRVLEVAGGFGYDILSQILDELKQERPEESDALSVIRKNLEWKTKMRED